MQHPDEGTIHAWLDGALGEGEAARVEEHVATCAECEARLVEARGLIAGASRVLAALDAVPAGVIPAREAVPDDGAPERPRERTLHWWRRRGVTPALAAAAAVAFVAVGSRLVLRERPNAERVTMVEMAPAPHAADSVANAQVEVAPPPQRAATDAARPAPAVVAASVAPHRETETRARVAEAAKAAKAAEPRAPSAMAMGGVVGGAAGSSNAATPAPAPPPLAAPSAGAGSPPRAAAADLAERKFAMQPSVDSVARATSPFVAQRNAAIAAAPRRAAGRDAALPADARPSAGDFAGCYAVVEGDVAFVPRQFVLDTTIIATIVSDSAGARPIVPLATTRLARSVDAERPATGRWSALGPVARVTLASPDGKLATLELRATMAQQFDATLTVDGAARTVSLRRCAE